MFFNLEIMKTSLELLVIHYNRIPIFQSAVWTTQERKYKDKRRNVLRHPPILIYEWQVNEFWIKNEKANHFCRKEYSKNRFFSLGKLYKLLLTRCIGKMLSFQHYFDIEICLLECPFLELWTQVRKEFELYDVLLKEDRWSAKCTGRSWKLLEIRHIHAYI